MFLPVYKYKFPLVMSRHAPAQHQCPQQYSSVKMIHERLMRVPAYTAPTIGGAPTHVKTVSWCDDNTFVIHAEVHIMQQWPKCYGGECSIVTTHNLVTTPKACTHSQSVTWGSVPRSAHKLIQKKKNPVGFSLFIPCVRLAPKLPLLFIPLSHLQGPLH